MSTIDNGNSDSDINKETCMDTMTENMNTICIFPDTPRELSRSS